MNTNRQQQTATKTTTRTPAPQQAVQEYLDSLLQDATALADSEISTVPAVKTVVETAVVEIAAQASVVETPVAEAPGAEVQISEAPTATVDIDTSVEISTAPAETPAGQGWHNGRPHWAQERFECLLFQVAGLTLAVPLKELGGVLTIDDDLSPLFGQPDWFLGLLPSKTAGTVRTIDTARWVMPEKYTDSARDNLRYVILMEGTDWGMACHEVAEAISLEPDQVRWRSDRGRRPWLAGTVIEHMCAIMDVSALVDLVSADSLKIKAPQWTRQPTETS